MVFSISETGASHLPKNIPCQDSSASYESSDGSVKLVVVCDGHGSSSCVRSHLGSRFATEAAQKCVLTSLENLETLFSGKSGAVTTMPKNQDMLWNPSAVSPDSEKGLLQKAQSELYRSQVENLDDIEKQMRLLFSNIYEEWSRMVEEDLQEHEWTCEELAALGSRDKLHAYGTTLMCYVQTEKFWMAFHIGDGRLLGAETIKEELNWSQLVPWDCDCFLNHTTSLCGSNAVENFRYAFDGSGHFPRAVLCCSDGIEDSYGDYEQAPQYLHRFFSQVVHQIQVDGLPKTLENLREFLPEMSRRRSQDDMSLAGVV